MEAKWPRGIAAWEWISMGWSFWCRTVNWQCWWICWPFHFMGSYRFKVRESIKRYSVWGGTFWTWAPMTKLWSAVQEKFKTKRHKHDSSKVMKLWILYLGMSSESEPSWGWEGRWFSWEVSLRGSASHFGVWGWLAARLAWSLPFDDITYTAQVSGTYLSRLLGTSKSLNFLHKTMIVNLIKCPFLLIYHREMNTESI